MNHAVTIWREARLGELCSIITGNKDVNEGSLNGQFPFFTCAEKISKSNSYSFDGEAILIAGNGNFSVKKYKGKFEAYQRTYVLQNFQISSSYLYYFINHRLSEITKDNRGSTIRYIRIGDLANYNVTFPSSSEQQRIVDKIEELFSELDKGIENLKTARAQLKVYRQALLKDAFEGKLTAQWREQSKDKLENALAIQQRIQTERAVRYQQQLADWKAIGQSGSKPKAPKPLPPLTKEALSKLANLPEGWGWCSLGDFIDSIDAGKSFKCDEREPNANEIGVAKVSAVTWGEYDESESKTCTDLSKVNESYFIQAGDFILSRANTIDLVGACVIARKVTKKIMLSDKTLRIKFGGFSEEYFLQYLLGRSGRKQIMQLSSGNQESMRNIGQDRIRSIIVPICSKAEAVAVLENLASKLSEVDQLDQTINVALQQSEALRQSILKKAFLGTLVEQDVNDEPASVLLARIKAEKAAQAVTTKPRKTRKVQDIPEPVKTNVIPFPVKIPNISATDLHAGLMAMAYQHHEQKRKAWYFGHVKAEKIAHMLEAHLGLDLERYPIKDAAGPNDFQRLLAIEATARANNWFDVKKLSNGRHMLYKMQDFDDLIKKTSKVLGAQINSVNALIALFVPLDKTRSEIVATLYAAWNNLLLLGHKPSNEEIVMEATENWHTDKLKIRRERFFKCLVWMREHGLVPVGRGRYVKNKD